MDIWVSTITTGPPGHQGSSRTTPLVTGAGLGINETGRLRGPLFNKFREPLWKTIYWVPQKLPQIYTVIISVLGRLRDLQTIFAVTYETLCSTPYSDHYMIHTTEEHYPKKALRRHFLVLQKKENKSESE